MSTRDRHFTHLTSVKLVAATRETLVNVKFLKIHQIRATDRVFQGARLEFTWYRRFAVDSGVLGRAIAGVTFEVIRIFAGGRVFTRV